MQTIVSFFLLRFPARYPSPREKTHPLFCSPRPLDTMQGYQGSTCSGPSTLSYVVIGKCTADGSGGSTAQVCADGTHYKTNFYSDAACATLSSSSPAIGGGDCNSGSGGSSASAITACTSGSLPTPTSDIWSTAYSGSSCAGSPTSTTLALSTSCTTGGPGSNRLVCVRGGGANVGILEHGLLRHSCCSFKPRRPQWLRRRSEWRFVNLHLLRHPANGAHCNQQQWRQRALHVHGLLPLHPCRRRPHHLLSGHAVHGGGAGYDRT